jgi:hypothetical protein
LAYNNLTQLAGTTLSKGIINQTLPSQSVTLFVVPGWAPFQVGMSTANTPGQLQLLLNGQPGLTYILEASSNLLTWQAISTNSLSSNSTSILLPMTNAASMFYRAVGLAP